MRRRFFVEQFDEKRAVLTGDSAHHLGRVLRAQPGQVYEVSDGESVWLGKIESVERDRVEFSLVEPVAAFLPVLEKTLLLAIVKFDSFEWALEKATELGVNRIVPLAAARSDKGLLQASDKRLERWKKLVFEASQQNRRVKLPDIAPLTQSGAAFKLMTASLRIMLSERRQALSLRHVLNGRSARHVAFAVGPEGGWTDQEFASAISAGFEEASLGSEILRTETAVTASLAVLNYALEPESQTDFVPESGHAKLR